MDILRHLGIENRAGLRGHAPAECGADSSSRDVFGEIGQKIERRLVAGGVLKGKLQRARIVQRALAGKNIFRKSGDGVGEVKAGARANDESAGHEEFRGAIPFADGEPGIGTEKAEDLVFGCESTGLERALETKHGVDGVVGAAIGKRSVEAGDFGAGSAGEGEAGHGDAVIETGGSGFVLERLRADGGDQNAIQMQPVDGEAGESDVSAMGRVEAAAEERDSHFADAK